jgi:hypothetical protein
MEFLKRRELAGEHCRVADDLTRRSNGVLQLIAAHQPAVDKSSARSAEDSSPPIGETSRSKLPRPVLGRV